MTTLAEEFDALAKYGVLPAEVPDFITDNLAANVALRPYQIQAVRRFLFYMDGYAARPSPAHLLFHMATGSGKTVLMAALILDLYARGHRNFLFFVNSSQIIEKTRDNFLNPASSKFLFAQQIRIEDRPVEVRAVDGFEATSPDAISIHFTTIQGLHSRMLNPKENGVTFEDFEARDVVMISDEAHHLNADTKAEKDLTGGEAEERRSWESTVSRILASHSDNLLLEFTATADLGNPAIRAKYQDKVLYDYPLSRFREDGYSKDIELRQADLSAGERMMQAVVLSQYRRKLAEAHGVPCKPVILMKSKTIAQSNENEAAFHALIAAMDGERLEALRAASVGDDTLMAAFDFIHDVRGVTPDDLGRELRLDFGPDKVANVNSPGDLQARQIALNTLEDRDNELRVIFAVDKLNEGWDVLNLFDIVRLYDTRDGRENKVGKTTMQEAQLIGRGARYFPFAPPDQADAPRDQRKYDSAADHPLRLLEQLHYHCSHNPKYIKDIRNALRETGMLDESARTVTLRVKPAFKATDLFQSGHVWLNRRITNTRDTVQGLDAYLKSTTFVFPRLMTGRVTEASAFGPGANEGGSATDEPITRTLKLSDFGMPILRFALDTIPSFHFAALSKHFPKLKSTTEFMTSDAYLGGASVQVQGRAADLAGLSAAQKLKIAQYVLHQIADGVAQESHAHVGSKEFTSHALKDVVIDRVVKMGVQGETGRSWADSELPGLSMIDLKDKAWHVYDDSYGTSEEKEFIRFINDQAEALARSYDDFHLIRNEKLFKLYAFADGEAFEPDFLLILRRKGTATTTVMQLFVEPKGAHLKATDQWKEEALNAIAGEAVLTTVFKGKDYTVHGLPFFNAEGAMKKGFEEAFTPFLHDS